MLSNLRRDVVSKLMRFEIVQQPVEPEALPEMHANHPSFNEQDDFDGTITVENSESETVVAPENRDPKDPTTWGKVGRNEPCPCGSGKKYKHCHGSFV